MLYWSYGKTKNMEDKCEHRILQNNIDDSDGSLKALCVICDEYVPIKPRVTYILRDGSWCKLNFMEIKSGDVMYKGRISA